jgi:hypothetical protein
VGLTWDPPVPDSCGKEGKTALWATRDVRTRARPGAVVLSLSQEPGTGRAATVARIRMRHTIEDFLADRAI